VLFSALPSDKCGYCNIVLPITDSVPERDTIANIIRTKHHEHAFHHIALDIAIKMTIPDSNVLAVLITLPVY
jgi:hypothetical protein